jgi:hypothetical protein
MGRPDEAEVSGGSSADIERHSRRRRGRSRSPRRGPGRIRHLYFTLASLWGFVAGSGTILVGLAALGRPLRLDPTLTLVLAGAGGLALLGGFVASAAYRDASRSTR